MKLNSNVSKFLTNKWVLNIVAILALLNVIGYTVTGNFNSVIYFIVIAVLVRYFSKNMTIVLGVPLIFVNLISLKGNMTEGMENNATPNGNNTNSQKNNEQTKNNQQTNNNEQTKINNLVKNNNSNKPDPKTGQGLVMQPLDNNDANTGNADTNNAAQTTGGEQQGFEPGRRKNRSYDIDYATTVEDAYDQLNNILGSDGIKRLTDDSQKLMQQQMHLAEAMKGMGPIIKQMSPMLESLKGMMGEGKEGLGGIMDLAKQFSSQASSLK
jgi:hypothetical protein